MHQWKGLHEYYTMETRKFEFFFSKKFEICLLTKSWNHLGFVNISPKLVIDTSMERSSRVLHHGNPKIRFFSKKFEICLLTKSWNHLSFVNISPTLVIDTSMGRFSRVLYHGNPKIGFFQKSSKFEFWLLTKSWNHLSFVNISPTLVNDTSMERSSRVLHHGNPKIGFFFFKKVRNSSFDFWIRAEITLASLLYQFYISNWYINGKVFTSTTPWKPKNWIFFKKVRNSNFDFWRKAEITLASSISVLH